MKKDDQRKTQPAQQADVEAQVTELQDQLVRAQENERRAVADYQNLMRRTQEERIKIAKLAARDVVESILQPLEHLYLAKEQLKDRGLDMVYQQFQQALRNEGLEEIEVIGQEFDPHTMEVVDKKPVSDQQHINKVIQVTQRGYRLNGEVIRHAKVVIGMAPEK